LVPSVNAGGLSRGRLYLITRVSFVRIGLASSPRILNWRYAHAIVTIACETRQSITQ